MFQLYGVVVLLFIGVAFAASPEKPGGLDRSFRCYPAHHIKLQWKMHIPAFTCRLGQEKFVLASSDLSKYANVAFDIKVQAHTLIKGSPVLDMPMTLLVDKVVPVPDSRGKRSVTLGKAVFGSSSSSSSDIVTQHHHHHQQQNVGGIGGRPGIGSGFGVGGGVSSGFGIGGGVSSGVGVGSGIGSGIGGGMGSGFGVGGGVGSGLGVGGGVGSGLGVGGGVGGGFGVGVGVGIGSGFGGGIG